MNLFFIGSLLAGAFIAVINMVGVLSIGAFCWWWIFPQSKKIWVIASAPLFGAAIATVALKAVADIAGWSWAVRLLFALGIICTILFYKKWQTVSKENPNDPVRFRWVLAVWLSLLAISLLGGLFDESWHFPLASIIANGVWPVPSIFDPSRLLSYHDGFDVLVAAHASFGLPVPIASDLWQSLLQASIVGILWLGLRESGLSIRRTWIGVTAVLCTGTLGWMLRPFRRFFPALSVIYPFTGTMTSPLLTYSFTKSTLVALGFIFIAIVIRLSSLRPIPRRALIFLPIVFAAIAQSSETIFVFFLPFLMLGLLSDPGLRPWRWKIVFASFIGLVLAVDQSSLLRQALPFHLFASSSALAAAPTSFAWRTIPILATFGEPLDLRTLIGWIRILAELGPSLLLAWFAFRSFKQWPISLRTTLTGSIFCLLIPLILVYQTGPRDLLRVWIPAFAVCNLLGILSLFHNQKKAWIWILLSLSLVGGLGSVIMTNLPMTTWISNAQPIVIDPSLWEPFLDSQARLPTNSIAWISVPRLPLEIRPEIRQIPAVFGVPVQACYDLYNHDTSAECDEAYAHPSIELFHSLKVTHLVLTDTFVREHQQEEWFSHLEFLHRYPLPAWAHLLPAAWRDGRNTEYQLYHL